MQGRRHIPGFVFVAFIGVCVGAFFGWPRETAPPPDETPIDPRHEHKDVDAGEVDAKDVFAAAMTGHRGKVYFGDVDDIQARGVVRVLTRNNASGYFVYRGVERGFDYELADRIAKELGVRLEMVVAPTRRDLIPWLLEGRGDVIIAGLSTESPRADRVRFSSPYEETRWVVVVPTGPKAKTFPSLETIDDLSRVALLVRPSSSALRRLRGLDVKAGLTIVAAEETLESEDLLDEIKTKIDTAAVVEERVAKLELLHRHDLRIALTLDGEDKAGMATRKEDVDLAAVVDAFVVSARGSSDWNTLYTRYHESKRTTVAAVDDKLRADKDGRLTPFDESFRAAAAHTSVRSPDQQGGVDDDVALDWRLLAAVAVQESKLDKDAQSPFGAKGLMQLLPSTAEENGCDEPGDPPCAIEAAARYLSRLARQQSKPWQVQSVGVVGGSDAGVEGSNEVGGDDGVEPASLGAAIRAGFGKHIVDAGAGPKTVALKDRVRFALASYNAGAGHVDDARALAATVGLDPDRWFGHVEQAMLLLEKPRYYTTTPHGFARGSETVAYVSEIQSRFDVYVSLTDR